MAIKSTFPKTRKDSSIEHEPKEMMPLNRFNFIYMIIAGVLIVVGFLLMLGPSSTPDHFEPDVFSTRRIVIGPLLTFIGFVAMGVAIIVSPTSKKK